MVTIVASFWMIGSIFVSLVALICFGSGIFFSWRTFLIICSLPSAIGAIFVYLKVPESPRFLANRGNYYEASVVTNSLTKKLGYSNTPLSPDEICQHFSPAESANKSDSFRIRDGVQRVLNLYSSSADLCRLTIITQLLWFSISFGSYGLITWINAIFEEIKIGNIYGNALLFALANLPGNIFSAVLVDSLGRRKILIISMVLASISISMFALVIDLQSINESLYVVLCACAFQAFSVSGWNAIGVLTSEIFPTQVRSTGVGICSSSGRIGSMIAQIVNGALIDRPELLLIVSALLLLFGALIALLLPSDLSCQPLHDKLETSNSITDDPFQRRPSTQRHGAGVAYINIQ